MEEVAKLIKERDITKSSSIDHISSRVLRDAFEIIPEKLTYLFNLSISVSAFPQTNDVCNLRPVSLLPLPGRLLETVINRQTINYLDSNEILTHHQNGFRLGRSTIATISDFTDDIFSAIDLQKMMYALYIDFRKASDCINHSILISKLGKVGFHSETVNWFRSYLFNWSQRTLANGRIPNVLPVTHGVPQGSILLI